MNFKLVIINYKIISFCFVFFLCCFSLKAQHDITQVFNTENSELTNNTVRALAVDENGVKWIGTDNGLLKYENDIWTIFQTASSPIPDNQIRAISVDSANNIWILGRRQNKKGTEIAGYDFVINIEKSRFVKEKSKIPITVSWEGGVETYSGLLEVALVGGYVTKPSNGWYAHVDQNTGEVSENKVRESATLNKEFWDPIFDGTDFKEFVKRQYTIGYKSDIDMDELVK